jgi:hypothetical protein
VDILDLFGDQEESYRASLWLYNSTQGVVSYGGSHDTIEAAEAALVDESGLELTWSRDTIDDGITVLAEKAYSDHINLAVVIRVENGDVVSHAPIVDGWVPEWHPASSVDPTAP